MAMEKSKCTPGKSNANASNKVKLSKKVQKKNYFPAARASKKIVLPDPSVRLVECIIFFVKLRWK